MSNNFERQGICIENFIPQQVGQGHFCGGNQVIILLTFEFEGIFGELG